MATSDVDKKFLLRFAKNIEEELPEVSRYLYIIAGKLVMLGPLVVKARKARRLDTTRDTESTNNYATIIWYAKEGIEMLNTYVLPHMAKFTELKTLTYKLRASYYHLYVLFANTPPVRLRATVQVHTPPGLKSPRNKLDKGKGVDRGTPDEPFRPSSVQPTHPLEGGPVGGSQPPPPSHVYDFLIPPADYRQTTLQLFVEACTIAEKQLWGSHPLRLSAKVEMCAFLYDCMHDREGSRILASQTIAEVYNAKEGMDDELFEDAAELVGILGRMAKRGTGTSSTPGTSASPFSFSAPPMPGMANRI